MLLRLFVQFSSYNNPKSLAVDVKPNRYKKVQWHFVRDKISQRLFVQYKLLLRYLVPDKMLLQHFIPFWSYNNPKSFCNIQKREPIQLLHVCSHPITLFSAKFAPNTSVTYNEREYIDYDVMYLPISSFYITLRSSERAHWPNG